ncbi:sensor domain-containing diguanylate cyclase/phosphohydrolase [Halanaerobium salsuginis]|uniref:Diguanylate cyclase (GGDEF) domain-containing protein n=1 Tax=Halanaerobium salsuginis TaxID=29563 RepID=A0A1I4HFX6_9FIRM|nr:HD domain-containing phosphohydrolase [Halanaerobium salsuginis]SFL40627.1 diguanylate cyclase (GGDEF) domain-containing protein [Halanaerobium salsuginis]
MNKDQILILVKNIRNQQLLEELLAGQFDLKNLNSIEDYGNIDLIITDFYSYAKSKKLIKNIIKQQQPLLLPLILITRQDKKEKLENNTFTQIRDIVEIPVAKDKLLKKINYLLKLRLYSKQAEKKYDLIVENSPIGICVVKNQQLIYVNSYLNQIFSNKFRKILEVNQKLKQSLLTNQESLFDYELKLDFGNKKVWLIINSELMPYQEESTWIYIIKDITEQKQKEARINYMLYHDELTGLYNRRYLNKYLNELAKNKTFPISFISIDINGLKKINELFGNQSGDQVLIKLTEIIKVLLTEADTLFRVGGDEFLISLPAKKLKQAEELMDEIKTSSFEFKDQQLQFSIGTGAAARVNPAENLELTIERSVDNMYLNKMNDDYSLKSYIVKSMLTTLEAKSFETNEHADRMRKMAISLGKEVNLKRSQLDELSMLAVLHDIGKVAIPESILKKPARLTEEEFKVVKTHPEIGYRIVQSIPKLENVAQGVLAHHEKWNGQGYPQGLKGETIPIIARIITIIDSFDVMINKRSYKEAYSMDYAVAELRRCSGGQFDPLLVNKFLTKVL